MNSESECVVCSGTGVRFDEVDGLRAPCMACGGVGARGTPQAGGASRVALSLVVLPSPLSHGIDSPNETQ